MIDVVCGVVNHNDKILITQRGDDKNYGKWEFPGGKVKKNEKPFDSIKRELFEELGLTVKPIKEIIRYSYKKFNLIFILCKPLNPNEIQLTEHIDYFWIGKTEFSKFQFLEGDISFIQNYLLNK